jgi:hypothetical protein
MTAGNEVREDFVSSGGSGKDHRTCLRGFYFGPDYRFDPGCARSFQEIDKTVETVCIGQGKMGKTGFFGLPAQDFGRTYALHHGIEGMDMEVDHG